MLNPFPIQFLALLAYFLLRICVSFVITLLAYNHITSRHLLSRRFSLPISVVVGFALAELSVAALLFIGMYTQYAILALLLLLPAYAIIHKQQQFPLYMSILLLFGAAISIFITGAGAFAFDLPI